MKKILIYLREHSAHLLKEKSSERLHGTIDIIIIYLHMHLPIVHCFRLELAFPPRTVFTPCGCSRYRSKYPYEKCFDGEKYFVEQYLSEKFSGECRTKICPL